MVNLYAHGGSGNHGCEAIVRSTAQMLQAPLRLFSSHPEQDIEYGLEQICEVRFDENFPINRGSLKWLLSGIETKMTGNINLEVKYRREEILKNIAKGDLCLSIGGDNYCYAGTDTLIALNNNLRKKGAKLVLWGCSIEPEVVRRPEVSKDLAQFELITARESISYEELRKINPNTVLVSDPAFILERKDLPLPDGWIEDNMIGINVSPLVLQSAKNRRSAFEAYKKLISEILETTDCGIVLIPHVVWKNNDDREPLFQLYHYFKGTKRIVLLEDFNCSELKGFIARCRMFIGARTHAAIAAYSSCVPTLVLGYSIKSIGIAKDIFGTAENYVLPVQHLKSPDELVVAFRWMHENEVGIRTHLQGVIPEYIQKAYLANETLKKLS